MLHWHQAGGSNPPCTAAAVQPSSDVPGVTTTSFRSLWPGGGSPGRPGVRFTPMTRIFTSDGSCAVILAFSSSASASSNLLSKLAGFFRFLGSLYGGFLVLSFLSSPILRQCSKLYRLRPLCQDTLRCLPQTVVRRFRIPQTPRWIFRVYELLEAQALCIVNGPLRSLAPPALLPPPRSSHERCTAG